MNDDTKFDSLIDMLISNLEEINSVPLTNDFVLGEKTAYVDCLEMIQSLKTNKKLNFVIQQKFPLIHKSE